MQALKQEIIDFEGGQKNLELRREFNRLLEGGATVDFRLENAKSRFS